MFIVHVFIKVKEDSLQDFIEATLENASKSLKEPGIFRFDFVRQQDDPTRFVLVEGYRTEADTRKHKETVHYKHWRDRVKDLMAEPRFSIKYDTLFPHENGWDA